MSCRRSAQLHVGMHVGAAHMLHGMHMHNMDMDMDMDMDADHASMLHPLRSMVQLRIGPWTMRHAMDMCPDQTAPDRADSSAAHARHVMSQYSSACTAIVDGDRDGDRFCTTIGVMCYGPFTKRVIVNGAYIQLYVLPVNSQPVSN